MPVRCAWCGVGLGDDAQLAGESHGICSSCEKITFPKPSDPAGAGGPRADQLPRPK